MRITVLVVFFSFYCAHFSFAQRWNAQIIDASEKILKNRTMEIGVLPNGETMKAIQTYLNGQPHRRKGLNPFVSWDIDIMAIFTHASTKEQYKKIGFWYTEIERDHLNSHWNQKSTDLPFRIRFAPPRTGKWNVAITAKVNNQIIDLGPIDFNVEESKFKGHVGIHSSKRYLERDGQIIMPTGVNLPYPYVNNNLLYSQQRDEKLNLRAWIEFRNLVQQYLAEGGKHFRFFIHPSCTDIEFQEVGYYQDRQHFAWEVDYLIEQCEENGALIDFNLMYHTMMMRMGDYYQFKYDYTDNWHNKSIWPYKDINHISGYSYLLNSKRPSDMIMEEEAFKYLREKTRYMMARWGGSPAISIVELVSEPWHIDQNAQTYYTPYDSLTPAGDRARKAMYKYHKELASYIKDSLDIKHKIIGAVGRLPVGSTRIYSHFTSAEPEFADSTWHDPNIDIISISYYSSSPEKALLSKRSSQNECGDGENSMACVLERLHRKYHKPILFGESDHGDGTHICSELEGHKIDSKRYAFTGAAGHYLWAAFNYPDKTNEQPQDERTAWTETIKTFAFYQTPFMRELFAKRFIQGREKQPFNGSRNALFEYQYLIDSTRMKCAGYLYNRTYNVFTASGNSIDETSPCYIAAEEFRTPVTITWKPQRAKVKGMRRLRKYKITYYGFKHGELLNTQVQRSSLFGGFVLKHPALIPEKNQTPLIWYTIERF